MIELKSPSCILILMTCLLCGGAAAQNKPTAEPSESKSTQPAPRGKADAPPDKVEAPAKDEAPPAQEPPTSKPEPDVAPDQPQPKKKPIKRRSVQQVIGSMPASPPIVTDGYRPTLTLPSPVTPSPTVGTPVIAPPPPVQLNGCNAGGCNDVSGNHYTPGVGNATVSPQGRLCNRVGNSMQCF
ncbi:MAG TPA: hypothetical protein VFG03_18445 [Telluria sp.]|nr:hypothetical protein [Telluria sp.]